MPGMSTAIWSLPPNPPPSFRRKPESMQRPQRPPYRPMDPGFRRGDGMRRAQPEPSASALLLRRIPKLLIELDRGSDQRGDLGDIDIRRRRELDMRHPLPA